MLNLIVNGIQPMSDDGDQQHELQITTDTMVSEGGRVGARDTGPGLSPESLARS
jgi:C4-dicarboxylate-specific signal transduction histidine kinase